MLFSCKIRQGAHGALLWVFSKFLWLGVRLGLQLQAPRASLRWFSSLRSPVSQPMANPEGPLVGFKALVREQIKNLRGLVLKFLEVL